MSVTRALGRRAARAQAAVYAYAQVAGPVIRRDFRPDCCIAATRVTLGVFQFLGLPARPWPCRLVAMNDAMIAWNGQGQAHHPPPADAWSVAIGFGMPPDAQPTDWDGHLVALVAGRWLVDASLGNVARPARGLALPPVGVFPAYQQPRGEWRYGQTIDGREVRVAYYPAPELTGWQEARDWTDARRTAPAVSCLVPLVRRALRVSLTVR